MAYIKLYRHKLRSNYNFLSNLFEEHSISWGIVSKLLCGNKIYLQELINLGVKEIHDSRLSNLKAVKTIDPGVQTVYIKPPAKRSIPGIVQYADVSLNSEYKTLCWLSEEAIKQQKIHKVIIMIEMGDLREGVMGEHLITFYEKVFQLPGIEIIGLGTNLNCLNGIMPSSDKLVQLSLYKQIIELKFNKKIPWVSAGTSVTIPLLFKHQLPAGINHFRVGETLFFGKDLFEEDVIEGMNDDVFELFTEIIELQEKPMVPTGQLGVNVKGEIQEIDPLLYGKTSYRAIIDIGLLDVNPDYLQPDTPGLEISGASSDMLIIDLGENHNHYKVGDLIRFRLKYMGALSILNSRYIDKKVE